MKKAFVLLLALLLAFSADVLAKGPGDAQQGGVRWRTYDQARKEARKKKRLIMAVLHASWCGPCRIMERTTWADGKVAKLTESAVVPVQFDVDKSQEKIPCGGMMLPPGACASAYWEIPGLPAFVFLDSAGDYVHQEVGLFTPEMMADFLEALEKETPNLLRELQAWKDSVAASREGR